MRSSGKWSLVFLGMVGFTITVAIWVGRPETVSIRTHTLEPGIDFDFDRIREHVETLASLDSRLAGSPGGARALDYLRSQLEPLSLGQIEATTFEVTVPRVRYAELEIQAASGTAIDAYRLYPLWPNLARTSQTSPEGLQGKPIYLGRGSYNEIEGKEIAGGICFLDWDTGEEWTRIPELGGKAVVFLGDTPATGWESRKKFLTIPADVPRFYVKKDDAPLVKASLAWDSLATIRCGMDWSRSTETNLLVRLSSRAGEEENPLVFQASYDSLSVVPELAPGAEQAIACSVLLEFARFLDNQNGILPRPVHLLFTGGQGTGMAGMIDYMDSLEAKGRQDRPALFMSLDLASHTDRFGVHCFGRMRSYADHLLRPRFARLALELKSFSEDISGTTLERSFVDAVNLKHGRGWDSFLPYRAVFASEIANLAGIPGIALASLDDHRGWVDTPDDTLDHLDLGRLIQQLSFKQGDRIGLLRILHALIHWDGPYVSGEIDEKWVDLSGQVQWLKADEDYTPQHPLRNVPVFLKTHREDKYQVGVRGMPSTLTDDEGKFSFKGLIDITGNDWYRDCGVEAYGLATPGFISDNPEAIEAYQRVVRVKSKDEKPVPLDGSILYAVDLAQEKDRPNKITLRSPHESLNLEVFPCGSMSLFGIADPTTLIYLKDLDLFETRTESPPYQFGFSFPDTRYSLWEENAATLWAPPASTLRITGGIGLKVPRFLLLNNTPENLRGVGIDLDRREVVPLAAFTGASDVERLNEARLSDMRSGGIESLKADRFHANAGDHLVAAGIALSTHRYREFESHLERGWGYAGKVYRDIFSRISSLMTGILFYLFLLAPSAYLLERILLPQRRIAYRIGTVVTFFLLGFLLLWFLHPAFRLTQSPVVVLVAFVLIVLSVVVTTVVFSRFDRTLRRQFKSSLLDSSAGRIPLTGFARSFEFGVQNIRNRPYRSMMTALTVVLVTFALLSFVSVSPDSSTTRLIHPKGAPIYSGFLSRNKDWGPLPSSLYESLRAGYGERGMAGREWFFSDGVGDFSQIDLSSETGERTTIAALVGMEARESDLTHLDRSLTAGRWFRDSEDQGILLSQSSAEFLGMKPSDLGNPVSVYGRSLPLLGIFDSRKMNDLSDLDGESLAPVNFVLQRRLMAQRETYQRPDTIEETVHYSWENCAIVPFEFARSLGGSLRSIAVKPAADLDPIAEAISWTERTDQTFLASNGEEVRLISYLGRSRINAAAELAFPILLSLLVIGGSLMASLKDREREISIYHAIGLSPKQISLLFLVETSVYALLGGFFGSLLGFALMKSQFLGIGILGLNLNYTAGSCLFATGLSMATVLASGAYPAWMAYRPSRGTGITTRFEETVEGRIECVLPFLYSESQRDSVMAYLANQLQDREGLSAGPFSTEAVDVLTSVGREIRFRTWLAPFDLGLSQANQIEAVFDRVRNHYQLRLMSQLRTGDRVAWERQITPFIQAVRKILLAWKLETCEVRDE